MPHSPDPLCISLLKIFTIHVVLIILHLITFLCRKFYYHVVLGLVYCGKFGTLGLPHVYPRGFNNFAPDKIFLQKVLLPRGAGSGVPRQVWDCWVYPRGFNNVVPNDIFMQKVLLPRGAGSGVPRQVWDAGSTHVV